MADKQLPCTYNPVILRGANGPVTPAGAVANAARALKAAGIAYVELLRSTRETRVTAGALANVVNYLADPASPVKLSTVYEVWRRGDRAEHARDADGDARGRGARQCRFDGQNHHPVALVTGVAFLQQIQDRLALCRFQLRRLVSLEASQKALKFFELARNSPETLADLLMQIAAGNGQSLAQVESRKVFVEDGWLYFVHGWTQVISQVLHFELTPALFDELNKVASTVRK